MLSCIFVLNVYTMDRQKVIIPPVPVIPSSLRGYTDVLRDYSLRLHEYYRRRYLDLSVLFDNSQGGLMHLFLVPDAEQSYISLLMACYWLSEHGHVSRKRLRSMIDTSPRTLDYRISEAKRRGHLSALKRDYYELTEQGHEFINGVVRSFSDRLLEFYDLK